MKAVTSSSRNASGCPSAESHWSQRAIHQSRTWRCEQPPLIPSWERSSHGQTGKEHWPRSSRVDLGDLDHPSPLPFVSVLLFNYNIDGNLLKVEHKDYLDKKLIPLLKRNRIHVKLRGTASKSGASDYNKQLSLERVLRVKKYLISKGVPEAKVPGPDVSATGEDESKLTSDEDDRDRAVRITLGLGTKDRPIRLPKPRQVFFPIDPGDIVIPPGLPRLPLPPVTKRKKYKIQYLAGIGVSVGGSLSIDTFRIIDVEIQRRAFLCTLHQAAGVGLKGPSVTLPSEDNEPVEFECTKQSLGEFQNEPASFSQLGSDLYRGT